ncbi:MAG: glutathione S-transferase family protein [Alphaproteobacteria bacterium]|nr:glutathione S-transferase family protein [Alphaproteobacteria bacterium]
MTTPRKPSGFHLYGISWAGSVIAEYLFEWAGVEYTISFPDQAERDTPAYRAISPKGQIPVLVDEHGQGFSESLAITIYLLDRFPETGLIAPPGEMARGKCLQWLAYLATILYNANQRIYQSYSFSAPEDALIKSGIADRMICYDEIDAALASQPFLCGSRLTAADLYLHMLLNWDRRIDHQLSTRPRLKALFDHVSALPQVRAVQARQPKRSPLPVY